MRLVLAMVLAGLVALPISVSAQDSDEGGSWLERWHPEAVEDPAKPTPEEPALKLKVGADGVEVAPSQPRTVDGYTLEEIEIRVRRAKIGLGVSVGVMFVGGALALGGTLSGDCFLRCFLEADCPPPPPKCDVLPRAGAVLAVGGVVGMITSGILLRRRNRDWDSLREVHYGTPRRVRWDLARSRLVF